MLEKPLSLTISNISISTGLKYPTKGVFAELVQLRQPTSTSLKSELVLDLYDSSATLNVAATFLFLRGDEKLNKAEGGN
jgi:hypothetical protein